MYKRVYQPGHHRADVTGMVSEHVLIAERLLGRPLQKGEIVHHKDFDKFNNSDDNLLVPISRQEHQQLPEYQARFIIDQGLYAEFLVWWINAQQLDEENKKLRELEKKLMHNQNEQRRLQGKLKGEPK